jgi:hypothetical protein
MLNIISHIVLSCSWSLYGFCLIYPSNFKKFTMLILHFIRKTFVGGKSTQPNPCGELKDMENFRDHHEMI